MDTCGNPSFAAAKIVALSSDQNLIRPPEAEHECGDVSFAGRIPLIDTDVVISINLVGFISEMNLKNV